MLKLASAMEVTPIPVTPEVAPVEKQKPKRSAKPKREQPQQAENSTIQTQPAPEPTKAANEAPAAAGNPLHIQVVDRLPAPRRSWEWDRALPEQQATQMAQAESERLAKLPLPSPRAKFLPWPDFCEYWNTLRELPIAPCIRLYVQRWAPVLLPVIETDRFGGTKESHPSDLKLLATDGPLSEDLILQLGGVGDYTFRLNDTRRPWEQGTICQSQLETKRLWDTYPPIFDLKRLDYEDKKNQVFIKFARARGILPREDEMEKEQADMANVAAIDSVLEDSRRERARTDQLQREVLERAERETREAKDSAARLQAQANQPPEPKLAAAPSDLLNVVTSVAALAKSLQPAKDDSLSEYLKLQAEREKTEREREKEERTIAREAAAAERKRADDLQAQILADLKEVNKSPTSMTAAPVPRSDVDVLQEMVTKQNLLKQLTGRGGSQPEENPNAPSSIDKWLEAAPVVGPILQSLIGGIFQTVHFGLQTWQTISYNNALTRNGGAPKPPMDIKPPEPGQPVAPQGPPPTPEQLAQKQQWDTIMQGVLMLAPHLVRHLDKGKSGAELAEFVIENADEQRTSYDRIRHVADSLTRLGIPLPGPDGNPLPAGASDFERFLSASRFVFFKIPNLWAKIGTLETMPQFLAEFYNYDEIVAASEEAQK